MSRAPVDSRTYRGRTVEELLPRIQRELGADAIIVRRREGLTGGLAGFFQRPFVELEATEGGPRLDVYDEQDLASVSPTASGHSTYASHQYEPVPDIEHEPARAAPEHRPFYEREPPRLRPDGAYVTERLAELARSRPSEPARASVFEPLARGPVALAPSAPDPPDPFAVVLEQAEWSPPPNPASSRSPRVAPHSHTRVRANVRGALLELGVSERFADELIDVAATHILPLAPRAGLSEAVRAALAQRILVAPPLPTKGAAVVVVGPGGSGKTSCCAALLGAYRKGSPLPASCATLVRGAAGGELRMLLSPYLMKLTPIDAQRSIRALSKTRSEGLLVIDTPPLSRGDRSGMRRLATMLGELKPERVVIALPATLGARASAQLLEALRPLRANALAVTHADETDQIGVAVEAACTFGLAPEYTLDRARSGGWRLGRLDPTRLAATLLR
jgi:flagellar biosynthesis GTPase FlhF